MGLSDCPDEPPVTAEPYTSVEFVPSLDNLYESPIELPENALF